MRYEWQRGGWQAGISRTQGNEPVTSRAEAEIAARAFGAQVQETIDAENGIWMVRISERAVDAIENTGSWEERNDQYQINIETP